MSKKDWITSLLLDRPPMLPKKSGFCCLKKSLIGNEKNPQRTAKRKSSRKGRFIVRGSRAVDELTLQGKETKLFCAKIYQLSI